MIRISVMYPNTPGKRFDWDYYIKKHISGVNQFIGKGLVRVEVDKGIGAGPPSSAAPYVAIAHMYFNNMEDMMKVQAEAGNSMADIPNFTDIQPQIQISEILQSQIQA